MAGHNGKSQPWDGNHTRPHPGVIPSQCLYQTFVETARDVIWTVDLDLRYTYVSPSVTDTLGFDVDEIMAMNPLDTLTPTSRAKVMKAYREEMAREAVCHGDKYTSRMEEIQHCHKDGSTRWLAITTTFLRDKDGKPTGILGISHDITEQKEMEHELRVARDLLQTEVYARTAELREMNAELRAEIAERKRIELTLRASEEQYRSLYGMMRLICDNVPDRIWVKDLDGKFIFANRNMSAEFLGARDTAEPIGRTDMFFANREKDSHPENANWHDFGELCVNSDQVVLETKAPKRFDEFGNLKGAFKFFDVHKAPFWNEQGEMIGTVGCARDITNKMRLQEERTRLATAAEQCIESIMVMDRDGTIQYVNPAFERITGYSGTEVIGSRPLSCFPTFMEDGEQDKAVYEGLLAGLGGPENWTGRIVRKKKDGALIHVDVTVSVVRDSAGQIINYAEVAHDVTDKIEIGKLLLHAQKMEAVCTLAGGMAHDFNNILQVILGYAELVLSEKDQSAPEYQDLLRICEAGRSGAELVKRLLTFSRNVEPKRVPLNLNSQIVQVQSLLERTIPKMIEINLDLATDLAEIYADPTQMEQILMNLALNARDAMPNGGRLTIGTKNLVVDEEFREIHAGPRPGEYAMLTVSDTGQGMDKSTMDHIFEPFYTTKEMGRGTGLGLAMVYGIVEQHGGRVTCRSEVGAGTTFTVYLPVTKRRQGLETGQPVCAPVVGTEGILLIDDERAVRELGARILGEAGYQVFRAADGREALDVFRKGRSQISLVILNMFMPGMGGRECLEELLTIDPQTKVLIASGVLPNRSVKELLDMGAAGFIAKPCTGTELLKEVRLALDGAARDDI